MAKIVNIAIFRILRIVDHGLAERRQYYQTGIVRIIVLVVDVACDGICYILNIALGIGYTFFHFIGLFG